jgi:hypothetical protein
VREANKWVIMYYPYHFYNETHQKYYIFCKFELIKYKTFVGHWNTLFDGNSDPSPELCIAKYDELLVEFKEQKIDEALKYKRLLFDLTMVQAEENCEIL